MARMPGPEELGGLPSLGGDRKVTTYNFGALDAGIDRLLSGIMKGAKGISATAEAGANKRKQISALDALTEMSKFQWETKQAFDEAKKNLKPDQAEGFAKQWATEYTKKAREFTQNYLRDLDPADKVKFDQRLFTLHKDTFGDALKNERELVGWSRDQRLDSLVEGPLKEQLWTAAQLPPDDPKRVAAIEHGRQLVEQIFSLRDDLSEAEKAKRIAEESKKLELFYFESLPVEDRIHLDPRFKGQAVRITGPLQVGDKIFEFASGGRNRGAVPFGTYALGDFTSGEQRAATGFSYRKDAFPVGGDIPDPRFPGAPRRGILIHGGSSADIDAVLSSGCLAIPRDQWPVFKRELIALQQREGDLAITIGPEGAFIHRADQAPWQTHPISSASSFIGAAREVTGAGGGYIAPDAFQYLGFDDFLDGADDARAEVKRLQSEAEDDPDNTLAEYDLRKAVIDGIATEDDIDQAVEDRVITPSTGASLAKTLTAAPTSNNWSEVQRLDRIAGEDAEEAAAEAEVSYAEKRLITRATMERYQKAAKGDDPVKNNPNIKSAYDYLIDRYNPGSHPSEAALFEHQQFKESIRKWAAQNPNATREEVTRFQQGVIEDQTAKHRALGSRGEYPLPRFIPPGVTATTVAEEDLDAALEATKEAVKRGTISETDMIDEWLAIEQWKGAIRR